MKDVCRLKNRRQFAVVKGGVSRNGSFFSLAVFNHKNPDLPPRVGFTVTKKQGCAVKRNRIRRRLKEIVRLYSKGILEPGHDYVLIAKRNTLFAPFKDLCFQFVRRASHKTSCSCSKKIVSRKS
ncbi:MAG: ribonuclease P protein component [Candidatus Liberibacter ctenarytainae]|uniref:Ribonuclease P protein component n=1 Tax=Candidatus Liberibacter ctenarytainae TaxID=2020335 RepID=A0A937AJC2_9HYPH|nr:ribonuclease P protein component [Candidatus Liberibacter ctenarytainae]